MSHVTSIKELQLTDPDALDAACARLELKVLGRGRHKLFSGAAIDGLGIQLPGWRYPIVIDEAGQAQFDNYGGSWGDEIELDKLAQAYSIERYRAEAAIRGFSVEETELDDGAMRLQLTSYA